MNIDMRNIPEEFEANIREIMKERNIPATKALIYALEDRKQLNRRIEIMKRRINEMETVIEDLQVFKESIKSLFYCFNHLSRE